MGWRAGAFRAARETDRSDSLIRQPEIDANQRHVQNNCAIAFRPAADSVRTMAQDKPLLGVFLMLGFCVFAPMGDAVAKLLGQSVPIGQLLLVRFAVQAAILIPLVWLTGRAWRVRGRVLKLALLRTVLHIFGIGAMFSALQHLPLADAVAIAFVMPFIMLLLGKYILGEEVGSRRLLACAVGFIGTLLVVQPSFAEVGWPALLPLIVAVNFSFFMLVTRQIAKQTDPVGLQAVSGVMAICLIAPILLVTQSMGFAPLTLITPSTGEWALLMSIGLLGTLAHLLMTWSLRYAPSATLAPMQYLEIPVATVIGFVIFSDLPNGLAALGICITIAAGLYIVLRERAIARLAARVPAAA
jgi:drug/metabolite transporter (DMT)-like permease